MSKLVCPICNAATAFSPERICQKAARDDRDDTRINFVDVIASLESDKYAIVRCKACDGTFLAKCIGYNEWIAVYPILNETIPNEIPEPIKGAFKEANLCFSVEAFTAAVTMCQVALEAMWRQQKASRLNDLKEKGIISGQLFEQATEIRLWARLAKHELMEEIISKEDAEQLLEYLKDVLDAVYVQPARLAKLASKRKQIKSGEAS